MSEEFNRYDLMMILLPIIAAYMIVFLLKLSLNYPTMEAWNKGVCETDNVAYELVAEEEYILHYSCPICHISVDRY